jgi:hypothetical protein
VIEAGNIYPTDIVKFEDNQGLYRLQRAFFSEKEIEFADLAQHGDDYEVTLRVNNPSTQELTVFFEWQLPNAMNAGRCNPSRGTESFCQPAPRTIRSPSRCTASFHTGPKLSPPASPGPCI